MSLHQDRHSIMKLQNTKDKEKIFSTVREKRQFIFKNMANIPDSTIIEVGGQ